MSNNKRKERSEQKELADTRVFFGHGKYILAGVAAVVVLVNIAQLVGGLPIHLYTLVIGILAAIGFVVWGFWMRDFLADWRKVKNEPETRALHDEVVQDKGLDEELDAQKRVEIALEVADAAVGILDCLSDVDLDI